MGKPLEIGKTKITTPAGISLNIIKELGSGGEGWIYRAETDLNGERHVYALKWFKDERATKGKKDTIESLIRRGSPSGKFMWPMEVFGNVARKELGYYMPLVPKDFVSIQDLMAGRVDIPYYTLALSAYLMSDCFQKLHNFGLCYQDINWGNIKIHPVTGDIAIIDNDNISINNHVRDADGIAHFEFMAPELLRGETNPNTNSDRYALANLLFHIFIRGNPLDGRILDSKGIIPFEEIMKVYKTAPFIFDPTDPSNRPVPGFHDPIIDNWTLMPQFLKDLFLRSFCKGLKDPNTRVVETEWKEAFLRYRDQIVICPRCYQNFTMDPDATTRPEIFTCPRCTRSGLSPEQSRFPHPPVLVIRKGNRKRKIVLNPKARLYPYHISNKSDSIEPPVAEVIPHPKKTGVFGLKNLTTQPWRDKTVANVIREIPPGISAPIIKGNTIDFKEGYFGKII